MTKYYGDITKERPPKGFFVDTLERYLELEKISKEQLTLKHLSDNLRNYPLLVACWLAVGFMWVKAGIAGAIAAVLWGTWLAFFSVLTAAQSGLLFAFVFVDLYFHARGPSVLDDALKGRWEHTGVPYLAAVVGVAFLFSSGLLAVGLYGAVRP